MNNTGMSKVILCVRTMLLLLFSFNLSLTQPAFSFLMCYFRREYLQEKKMSGAEYGS